MTIINSLDARVLEGVVGYEEVLYRLHGSLESNPLTAYSICSSEGSASITLSQKDSSDMTLRHQKIGPIGRYIAHQSLINKNGRLHNLSLHTG